MVDLQPLKNIPQVVGIDTKPTLYHGEKAIHIMVLLEDETGRRSVEGTFTTQDKDGFGGVDFDQRKDPVALMVSKVKSVLAGTAEGV